MDKLTKLKKLQLFEKSPQAAIFAELLSLSEALETLNAKVVEIADKKLPDFPAFPEIPAVDLTETNNLLKQFLVELQKEKPKEEINVELKIE